MSALPPGLYGDDEMLCIPETIKVICRALGAKTLGRIVIIPTGQDTADVVVDYRTEVFGDDKRSVIRTFWENTPL